MALRAVAMLSAACAVASATAAPRTNGHVVPPELSSEKPPAVFLSMIADADSYADDGTVQYNLHLVELETTIMGWFGGLWEAARDPDGAIVNEHKFEARKYLGRTLGEQETQWSRLDDLFWVDIDDQAPNPDTYGYPASFRENPRTMEDLGKWLRMHIYTEHPVKATKEGFSWGNAGDFESRFAMFDTHHSPAVLRERLGIFHESPFGQHVHVSDSGHVTLAHESFRGAARFSEMEDEDGTLECEISWRRRLNGRRLEAVALGSADESSSSWLQRWRHHLSCWFVALPAPTQSQLGSCLGALALHVGSKLDASWHAAQLALGRAVRPARSTRLLGAKCGFVQDGTLELPAFPEFPEGLNGFTMPPIPRLVPNWQQLQSAAGGRIRDAQADVTAALAPEVVRRADRAAWRGARSFAVGGGTGACAGVIVASVLLLFGRARPSSK